MTSTHEAGIEPQIWSIPGSTPLLGKAALAWMPIGLLFVTQSHSRQTFIMGREISWAQVLVDHLPAWGLWIMATPLLMGAALRLSVDERSVRWRALVVHGLMAATLTFVVSLTTYLWIHALRGHSMSVPRGFTGGFGLWRSTLASQLLLYAGLQVTVALVVTKRTSRQELPLCGVGPHEGSAEEVDGTSSRTRWVTLRTNTADLVVLRREIEWAEAGGDVMHVKARGRRHVVRERFGSVCDRIEGDDLVRVHRSALVSLDDVESIEPYSDGEIALRMRDGKLIKVSRSRRGQLESLIGRRH